MAEVLIIDDDTMMNDLLCQVVVKLGHHAYATETLKDGLDAAIGRNIGIIILDVHLPDGNGLDILPQICASPSSPDVIVLTGEGSPDGAEVAIKNGALDYISKGSSIKAIERLILQALEYRRQKSCQRIPRLIGTDRIISSSTEMQKVREHITYAAESDANTLILGETGTGKELIARTIHDNSSRRSGNFVIVDCAALPESLVESILFGHTKGAFTGADNDSEGLIQQSNGGTLFLDEVGELPLSIQKSFLRVVQERRFRPVSGKNEVTVNFRLIAATNRNLDQMVRESLFRNDLLYRIRSIVIDLPPLRERKEDISALAKHYLNHRFCVKSIPTESYSSDFFDALNAYSWPGNVRELFNALEGAIAAAGQASTLFPFHLSKHIRAKMARDSVEISKDEFEIWADEIISETSNSGGFCDIKSFRERMERRYLTQLLKLTNNSRKQACHVSGLSRTRLFELIRKHKLDG